MAKVIVERPRRAGVTTKGVGRVRDIEDLPRNQGMTRPHRMNWGGKELNENLAPLRRFLMSRVGESWDSVYSEISKNLRVTHAVQQHVRDHVQDFVVTNVKVDEHGVLWGVSYGSPFRIGEGWWRRELYVDPRDGVLKRTPEHPKQISRRERMEAEHALTCRVLNDTHQLRKHMGVWYECEVKCVPDPQKKSYIRADGTEHIYEVGGSAYDVILKCTVYKRHTGFAVYASTYCASKRQLNKSELKKHGVSND
jgi:hypothetical protein